MVMNDTATTTVTTTPGSNLRAELMELVHRCPVDRCNPADCPLFEVRRLSYHQRLQWFSALTEADLEFLAAYHFVCLKRKLEARPELRKQLPAGRV